MLITYYTKLGISENATSDEIKSAYRKLVLIYHPDRQHFDPEKAASKFREIQKAYECLSDPARRRKYDSDLWLFQNENQKTRYAYRNQSNHTSQTYSKANGSKDSSAWNTSYATPNSPKRSEGIFSLKWIYSFGILIVIVVIVILCKLHIGGPANNSATALFPETSTTNNSVQELLSTFKITDLELLAIQRAFNDAGEVCDWHLVLDAVKEGYTSREIIDYCHILKGSQVSHRPPTAEPKSSLSAIPPKKRLSPAASIPSTTPPDLREKLHLQAYTQGIG